MNILQRLSGTAIALVIISGCGQQTTQKQVITGTVKPTVYTTFYPTRYFVERIAGNSVKAICPVPEDADAIFWMPGATIIQEYQKADLIVLNGAGFAKWIGKVSLPESRVVNSSKALSDRFIDFNDTVVHSHGKLGEHAHEGLDGHTWVDPVNARIQAKEIASALMKRFPQNRQLYEKGFSALAKDLDALDETLKEYQKAYRNQPILASHPAYNYIAKRYKWNIRNLDLDPNEMPSEQVMKKIAGILKEHPAKYLLWESAPTRAIAERFQNELGLKSIEFSPCELLSAEELDHGSDYISVMRGNLQTIAVVFDD